MYGKGIESDDSVTLDESLGQVTQSNVEVKFKQKGADVPLPKYTGLPITLKAGMSKTFTISTDATEKYEAFTRTVTVKATKTEVPKKPSLNVKTLTIHGKSAASGKVTISTDKNQVIKADIKLEFLEEGDGVPESRSFSMSPESVSLANAGDKATLTLSTQETEKYNKWELAIEVTREKTGGQEKTIDDCVATLTSQLTWAGIAVDKPISLPTTVTGYDASTVEWSCEDEHIDIATGKIKKDLIDITVEIKAKVTWKGQNKTVTFTVTVQRIKKIKWTVEYSHGGKGEYEVDLSKDGVLQYFSSNKLKREYEIKNVDVKGKKLILKLIKEEDRFSKELLTADEYIQKEQKRHNESIERHFGLKYVELENKTNITWDDLKAYLIHSGYNYTGLNTNDEQAFDNFKRGKVNENYQGSFDDFKGLSPAERDKVVKDFLKRYKNEEAFVAGLAENLPTTEFVTQLKNHKLKMSTIYYMGSFEDKTYQYTLEVKK